jgi:chromosome segregation ATPase
LEKEDLIIKRLEEAIKKWDLQVAEIGKKIESSEGKEKQNHKKKTKELSDKIAEAKKEINKIRKKIEFP